MTHEFPTNETEPRDALSADGWFLSRQAVPDALLIRLRDDLQSIYKKRRAIQIRNGIGEGMVGTCHHLLGENSAMDDLIKLLPLHDEVRSFFGSPYILNSFGGFINKKENAEGYIGAIHRDVRTFSRDFRLMINMLVMLDDFTTENGATYLMPGSQHDPDKPTEHQFRDAAVRATGTAGDILVFDSRLWHAAGSNATTQSRCALTLTFTRPFFKPQLDYPQFLGENYAMSLSPEVRQVLGYDAQVPRSIDAFYQPPARRAYKSDQG